MDHLEQWRYRRERMADYVRLPQMTLSGRVIGDRPELEQGQMVALKRKPEKQRRVLHAEWHYKKRAWSYGIGVEEPQYSGYEAKFLLEELEVLDEPVS